MAHFAEIDLNNKVLRVIVVNNTDCLDAEGNESEEIGNEFCRRLLGGTWVQTSYNAKFRKHYAGIDFTYDSVLDAFIPPKPYSSWVLDTEACTWVPPIPSPGENYVWNEELQQWDEIPLSDIEAYNS